MQNLNVAELAAKVVEGSRGHMARAITLVESTKPEHRVQAYELLQLINLYTGRAFRIGISGVPGADKSTFISAMGIKLIKEHNRQVAILAIDPSSTHTGDSILDDRTHMGDFAMRKEAFIRPLPSIGHLGGVARTTCESMLVLEAADYDITLVETVGMGQSEVTVTGMIDTLLLLRIARTGGQLQGIRRNILELANVISIIKADDGSESEARISARELNITMKLISSGELGRRPPILTCSSHTGTDTDEM